MKPLLLIFFSLSITFSAFTQTWNIVKEADVAAKGIRDFQPTSYIIADIEDEQVKSILWSAPYESANISSESPARLKLMKANGETEYFAMVRYSMMEPMLAQKFDHIRTFKGISMTNPRNRVRLDYTVHGLRAVIKTTEGTTYIEHFQRGDKSTKIIYDRKDYPRQEIMECSVTSEKIKGNEEALDDSRQGACLLRTFRLANAANGEYSAFHATNPGIPDVDEVHSAVVTTVNRVNEVYEQDFGSSLILVDNNELLYFFNAATDPYSNGDGGAMLGQNQTEVDGTIGNANYDIGHVFSTGGGGVAYLSSVCNNSIKAGGVTGQTNPTGDPFDIDYVAHEMGHQMGANHTQNNNCNRNGATAMEPGSASTIMGYAGICFPNVQNNSDDHFHAISIQEVMNDASTFSCSVTINNFGNTAPTVTVPAVSYTIPKSTFFVLEATGNDADGDPLTYNWEQMDNEVAPMPPETTNTSGPAFRSNSALVSPKRFFPAMPDILVGNSPTWEVIPSVGRNMDFRVTVRDWHDGPGDSDAGCTEEADVSITFDGASGPFIVTSHSTPTTWAEGENVTITWDVANTNSAPVNCSNVDIYLSLDGTFENPTLITTTPNNGSAMITVPTGVTTTGRYMVKGSNNIFFDINDANITIESVSPTFFIAVNPEFGGQCYTGSTSTTVITSSLLGYNTPINLSVSGLPAGAIASFSNNPVTPGNSTTVTLSNLINGSGSYNVIFTAVSGSISKQATYELIVAPEPVAPALVSPADMAIAVSTMPTLTWTNQAFSLNYDYRISTSPNGVGMIETGTVVNNFVDIATTLLSDTEYYWSVSSKSFCGTSDFSDDYTFTTGNIKCATYQSIDVPLAISSSGTPTITSDLMILDRGDITDLNIINLEGNHTYVSDLKFTLTSPTNTSVLFFESPCNNQNNFDINFDDDASNVNSTWPCPPTDGLTYVPDNPLSAFSTNELKGNWVLTVTDIFNLDGGSLNNWELEICANSFCDLTVSSEASSGDATLVNAINCAIDNETIYLNDLPANTMINLPTDILLNKSINIIADPTNNITVNFTGSSKFEIASGKTVSLSGFTIAASNALETISNSGDLTLTDMTIIHPTQNQVMNNATGTLNVLGTCNIKK